MLPSPNWFLRCSIHVDATTTLSLIPPVVYICSDRLRIKSTATARAIDQAMVPGPPRMTRTFLGNTGRITPGASYQLKAIITQQSSNATAVPVRTLWSSVNSRVRI